VRPVQNRMKTAAASPNPNEVVETTTTRRVLPVGKERTTPEFWEYLETLPRAEYDRHIFYIYRDDPGPTMQVAKHTWQSAADAGIPWNDREEAEAGFLQRFGGRTFRVMVKRNSERITTGRIYVPAAPKTLAPSNEQSSPTITPMSEAGATADVAKMAMHTLAGQEQRAAVIGMDMMATAANVVKNFSQHTPPAPSETDTLMKQALLAMLQKALNPPPPPPAPDPLDTLTKLLAVMREMNPSSSSNPVLGKIMDAAVEKILNPTPSGPSSSTGAELVRALPQIASYASQALADWRVGSEAQLHTAEIMRGGAAPPNGASVAPNTPSQTVLPAPRPNPAPQAAAMTPSLEWVESKIIEILKEPLSADKAADEVCAFLDRLDPTLMGTLAGLGEAKLVELFQTRPVLREATSNMPRLLEFIRAFLKYAATSDGAPNADAPSKP